MSKMRSNKDRISRFCFVKVRVVRFMEEGREWTINREKRIQIETQDGPIALYPELSVMAGRAKEGV